MPRDKDVSDKAGIGSLDEKKSETPQDLSCIPTQPMEFYFLFIGICFNFVPFLKLFLKSAVPSFLFIRCFWIQVKDGSLIVIFNPAA